MGSGGSTDKAAFDAVVSKYHELSEDPAKTPDAIAAALRDEYVAQLGAKAASRAAREGDYAAVRATLVAMMDDEGWDDGSYAPVLIRLAWHSSGTYCAASRTGGSNGATMRFAREANDGENAGLDHPRAYLEACKAKHPWISYSDLWILAAYVAIEHTGGPSIAFEGGRVDACHAAAAVCPGRLPGAEAGCEKEGVDEQGRVLGWEKLAAHMRTVFYRMGLSERELVALVCGGHLYGRCHPEHSGYAGPWIEDMTHWSNEYAADLVGDRWTLVTSETPIGPLTCPDPEVRPAPGKRQYVSLGPPDAFERVEGGGDAKDYPPGQYVVSEGEEWINARATPDPKSAIVAQPVEGVTYTIVETRANPAGGGVRGRVDAGGWVSIVSGGAYPLLQRVDGALEPRGACTYRVVAGAGAPVRAAADGASALVRTAAPNADLGVGEATLGPDGASIFAKVADGWLTIARADDGGVLCDRIEEGYLLGDAEPTADDPPIKQMMLVSDMVLLWDDDFRAVLEEYADDDTGSDALQRDFGAAFKRLTELGFKEWPAITPFPADAKGDVRKCPFNHHGYGYPDDAKTAAA